MEAKLGSGGVVGTLQNLVEDCATGSSYRVNLPSSADAQCGCRVDACGQGALVADAYQHAASAELAFFNAGALKPRASLASSVTLGDLYELLPFTDEVVRLNISGSVIKAALAHGISRMALSDAAANPSGRFLQVSSNVKYEWYFKAGVPTLSLVYIAANAKDPSIDPSALQWVRLDESRAYTVATNAFVVGGGDGFSLFADLPLERLGVSDVEAAVGYFAANNGGTHATSSAYDAMDLIRQLPDRLVLEVRLLPPPAQPRLRPISHSPPIRFPSDSNCLTICVH